MSRSIVNSIFAVFVSTALMSCGSIAADGPDQPALLVNPAPEALAQLQQALVEASHGAPVTIAGDVFSNRSRLALEQGRLGSGQSPHLTGRDLGKPRIFRLVRNSRGCWLVRAEDSARWHLDQLTCVPE